MSDLFRKSVNGAAIAPPPARPRPDPISIQDTEEPHPLSDSSSSSSSADSAASVNTIRPSSREAAASPTHWTNYFAQELYLEHSTARYHVYLTPPQDVQKGPLFICHHGAGASGLSFALFAKYLHDRLPHAGVLSLEARGHGSVVTALDSSQEEVVDFSITTLATDALNMINLTREKMAWPSLPPIILVGHSLGGAIVTELATTTSNSPSQGLPASALIGYCVLDVVEGSALEALSHMRTYLSSRPSLFNSIDEAIDWHVRTRTIRSSLSAQVSVPSLISKTMTAGGRYIWRTDLTSTAPWWESWFKGMSAKFLSGRGAKMLILAGTDRLDRDLMIGQMQGKFQLVVLPEAGHFVQEDVPERTAELLAEFFRRNDRSALVLPPKVSDLLAQGKKV